MDETENKPLSIHWRYKFVDPITKLKGDYDVCAEVTEEQFASAHNIGIDMKQKVYEAMNKEARQASYKQFFESIRKNAKSITVDLNDNEHIWYDFYKPIIDAIKLMKDPVILCNCMIRNIMQCVPTNFKIINYGTNYSKETICLNDKEVRLITDKCMHIHDYNVLVYDRKNKRAAVNILYVNRSEESDLFILFENHRHQRMINIL